MWRYFQLLPIFVAQASRLFLRLQYLLVPQDGGRLQDVLRTIFDNHLRQVVLLLAEDGLLSLKELYTDGTKIESVFNRHTVVWMEAVQTSKANDRYPSSMISVR